MRYPGRGNFMVWRFFPTGPQKNYEEFDFFFETAHPTKEEMEAISYIETPCFSRKILDWLRVCSVE